MPFVGEYWYQRYSDLLPRAYVVADGARPAILKHNDTDDETQYVEAIPPISDDAAALAAPPAQIMRARAEAALPSAQQSAARALPAVLRAAQGEGAVQIGGIDLSLSGLTSSQTFALTSRAAVLGLNGSGLPVSGRVVGAALPADIAISGGYRLTLEPAVPASMRSIPPAFTTTPCRRFCYSRRWAVARCRSCVSRTRPVSYCGMHVDVARNFRQPATLRCLIDQMSAYKLNRLHLSDDEGWRIEIPGLPELTAIGGQCCHDLTETTCLVPQLGSGSNNESGGGYLKRAEYVALVSYAADRFVEIVPEIDMPDHARAAVVSMEARYRRLHALGNEAAANAYRLLDPADTTNATTVQFYDRRSFLNPCMDSLKRFASKVIGEMAAMHREGGAPLSTWHFGGDEAKNILLGAGFQALDGTDAGRGHVNLAAQDQPWARSLQCAKLIASGKSASVDELPSMFAYQVSQIVSANGIGTMAAWQDGIKHANGPGDFATSNLMVTMWDTIFWGAADTVQSLSKRAIRPCSNCRITDYLYFDFPYSVDQRERGYLLGLARHRCLQGVLACARQSSADAEIVGDRDGQPFSVMGAGTAPYIEGMQGQAWAEVMRNDQQFEYMVYPRLLALAERVWHGSGLMRKARRISWA